jgi:NAD(P)-dependent dehydrogenase (short-subunit alcohol dehydrogenase family)
VTAVLLEKKTAIIYGGAGSVGSEVARAFVDEGARVFLCGRTPARLDAVAAELRASGGDVHVARVDATDPTDVERHFGSVVDQTRGVDISFNLIGLSEVQGQPLTAMALDDYMRPIETAARTQFITATTAARHMGSRHGGVIMAMTATPARLAIPLVGGFGAACGVIECMLRTLAAEVGPSGVRVCWLRSAGSPESFGPDVGHAEAGQPAEPGDDAYLERLRDETLLKRFPRLGEVATTAALLASDRASAMTGAAGNITCGQVVD